MKHRPFGIYRYNQHKPDPDGVWERIKWFDSMEAAMQSLRDLTKRSKKKRVYTYIILPVESSRRYIQIDEDKREDVLKAGK